MLLVCGESDQVVPTDRQHDMARKLGRCKEVTFSATGHMLANERPDVAAREVLAFVDHDREPMTNAPRADDKRTRA